MLAKLVEPIQDREPPGASLGEESRMPPREADAADQAEDAVEVGFGQKASLDRVSAVEDEPDGDGFAMAQLVARAGLELVRGPMAEVEGASAAVLEGVAPGGDVLQVQLGRAADGGGR